MFIDFNLNLGDNSLIDNSLVLLCELLFKVRLGVDGLRGMVFNVFLLENLSQSRAKGALELLAGLALPATHLACSFPCVENLCGNRPFLCISIYLSDDTLNRAMEVLEENHRGEDLTDELFHSGYRLLTIAIGDRFCKHSCQLLHFFVGTVVDFLKQFVLFAKFNSAGILLSLSTKILILSNLEGTFKLTLAAGRQARNELFSSSVSEDLVL